MHINPTSVSPLTALLAVTLVCLFHVTEQVAVGDSSSRRRNELRTNVVVQRLNKDRPSSSGSERNKPVVVVDTIVGRSPPNGRQTFRPNILQDVILPSLPPADEDACKPRMRNITIKRYGCHGTAEIGVCEGMCATAVRQRRRYPFALVVHRACYIKKAKPVTVALACSTRALQRIKERRLQVLRNAKGNTKSAVDWETLDWLHRGPHVLLSATSCECRKCDARPSAPDRSRN